MTQLPHQGTSSSLKIHTHGTAARYNVGCRCDRCKKAKSDYRKNTPVRGHGTKWYYDKGCRCDACIDAKQEYRRNLKGPPKRHITTDVIAYTRVCYLCKKKKSLEEFVRSRNPRHQLGRSHECRQCHNERNKKNKGTPRARFNTYKAGAKYRGIEFHLSFDEFESFWGGSCFYCGGRIDGIGLDRIDSSIGYQVDNVVRCCPRCNKAKGTLTQEEFITMCKEITKNIEELDVS